MQPNSQPNPTTNRIYLDNAATSFPKPKCVLDAIIHYQTSLGASPGRGAYQESQDSASILDQCRHRLATLINAESHLNISFALNTTDALNTAIKGLLLPLLAQGQHTHAIVGDMEHNSILRPLNALKSLFPNLVTITRLPADQTTGRIKPPHVQSAITPNTKLVAINHASNVTGTIQPIQQIAAITTLHNIPLIVDAAQTAGHLPINVQQDHIDILAAPGHKGLLGPLGTGFLYIREGLENHIHTSREGGTGSISEQPTHPIDRPDKYEAGSHNTLGIAGLNAALEYILNKSVEAIRDHHASLTSQFISQIHQFPNGPLLPGLKLLGPQTNQHRIGVFSVTLQGMAPEQLAHTLESQFNILTRPGLHCAPHAHETFNTDPQSTPTPGATRFSIGPFTTPNDINETTNALAQICEQTASLTTSSSSL